MACRLTRHTHAHPLSIIPIKIGRLLVQVVQFDIEVLLIAAGSELLIRALTVGPYLLGQLLLEQARLSLGESQSVIRTEP